MSDRIRVVQITSGFAVEGPSGGIGRAAIVLGQALNRQRFEPVVCGLWYYGTPEEDRRIAELQAGGVEAFAAFPWREDAPYQSFWGAVKNIQARLAGSRVDILHSHSEFGDVAALMLKRSLQARFAGRTVHNQEWQRRPYRRVYLTNLLYPLFFDFELAVSRALTSQLNARPLAKALHRTARCVYPPFNFSRFQNVHIDQAQKKRSLGIDPAAPLVGSIGRLEPQKGYRYFVEAAAQVAAEVPEACFILVGSGNEEAALKESARSFGIADRVFFAGMRNDPEEMLAIMDVFVSTSLWEGLPAVLLEAMESGVPVIATDIAGSSEIISHAHNGLLTPAREPRATAAAILQVLHDSDLRARLVQQAKSTPGRFSIQSVAAGYEQVYCDLLGISHN